VKAGVRLVSVRERADRPLGRGQVVGVREDAARDDKPGELAVEANQRISVEPMECGRRHDEIERWIDLGAPSRACDTSSSIGGRSSRQASVKLPRCGGTAKTPCFWRFGNDACEQPPDRQ
jgi:hypothetical protein